jgi:hypothetical protein
VYGVTVGFWYLQSWEYSPGSEPLSAWVRVTRPMTRSRTLSIACREASSSVAFKSTKNRIFTLISRSVEYVPSESAMPLGQPVQHRTRCRRHSELSSDMVTRTSFVISKVVAVLAFIVPIGAQKRAAPVRLFITSVGFATMLVLLLLTSGCGSGFSPSGRPSGRWCDASTLNGGTMSATIDGTAWTAVRVVGLSTAREINASDCVHFLSIVIRGVTGPGTYAVDFASYESDPFNAGPSWTITSTGGSGSVTVTAATITTDSASPGNISGLFAFTLAPGPGATGTKVITNGRFDAKW